MQVYPISLLILHPKSAAVTNYKLSNTCPDYYIIKTNGQAPAPRSSYLCNAHAAAALKCMILYTQGKLTLWPNDYQTYIFKNYLF